ncbi:hypothetical protein A6R68_21710 [Neotoma lepida]|uniref:Uncharacterized protein n=1 Tax=Neotoma lepida TaxID=56216 RepID=A0A1A6HNR4_NEOLE|nr:hypothetical protein A6R68_21710 [Neotoma lepida]
MNNSSSAAEYYKEVLKQDNTHMEAIACIGSNHFYSDQPEARALLQTASSLAPHMYEPHFNFATVSDKIGDLQRSYVAARKSEEAFPEHVDTQHLIKQLKQHFAML